MCAGFNRGGARQYDAHRYMKLLTAPANFIRRAISGGVVGAPRPSFGVGRDCRIWHEVLRRARPFSAPPAKFSVCNPPITCNVALYNANNQQLIPAAGLNARTLPMQSIQNETKPGNRGKAAAVSAPILKKAPNINVQICTRASQNLDYIQILK